MELRQKNSAVEKAARLLDVNGRGGVSRLAKGCGVQPPTVSQWLNGVCRVPAEKCPKIERLTEGVVRCEDLRPDVEWSVLRRRCGEHAA